MRNGAAKTVTQKFAAIHINQGGSIMNYHCTYCDLQTGKEKYEETIHIDVVEDIIYRKYDKFTIGRKEFLFFVISYSLNEYEETCVFEGQLVECNDNTLIRNGLL